MKENNSNTAAESIKEELLEDITKVIREETTDEVDLLEESDATTIEIAKHSFARKDTKHVLLKTLLLITVIVYETFCILHRNTDIFIFDLAIFIWAWVYMIMRIKSEKQNVRFFLDIPLLIPIFLLYSHVDGGVDFLRWLMLIGIIIDYLLDFLIDLILHKQLLLVIVMWILIIYLGTIGYVRFENLNFNDSFWLVWVTSTTVGYGDYYAITIYGRLVTIFLMLGGIAILSSLTAFILDFINKHSNERAKKILKDIEKN